MNTRVMDIAVFDLDGTITRHDTLVHFLAGFAARRPVRALGLWRSPVALGRYLAGGGDRGELKASLIRYLLGGLDRDAIAAWADEFCSEVLPGLLNPGALRVIEQHRVEGHRLVLLSASVDLYVPRIAERLGFHATLCTELTWREDRLESRLATPNRRGEEKLACLRDLRTRHPDARIAAYGNAASDLPHLVEADTGCLVNAPAPLQAQARALNLAYQDWR
ncbi:MAG: HAD family hydrolase [Steroidobacteraceae bacterium]